MFPSASFILAFRVLACHLLHITVFKLSHPSLPPYETFRPHITTHTTTHTRPIHQLVLPTLILLVLSFSSLSLYLSCLAKCFQFVCGDPNPNLGFLVQVLHFENRHPFIPSQHHLSITASIHGINFRGAGGGRKPFLTDP